MLIDDLQARLSCPPIYYTQMTGFAETMSLLHDIFAP